MLLKISKFKFYLSLRYKILIGIISTTTLCLILIATLCYNYFAHSYETTMNEDTQHSLKMASYTFNQDFNHILSATNKFISDNRISKIIYHLSTPNSETYLTDYNNFQAPFKLFLQSNNFISTGALIGKSKEFFSVSEYGWNSDLAYSLDRNNDSSEGIQFFPITTNPLSHYGTVIPMIIPISTMNLMPVISGSLSTSDANMALFLNAPTLTDNLNQYKFNADSIIYISQSNGTPLSLPSTAPLYQIATNSSFRDMLAQNSNLAGEKLVLENDTYLISMTEIGFCDLKLICITPQRLLLKNLEDIKSFIYIVLIINFILGVYLSFLLSNHITKPLNKLMHTVKSIELGNYNNKEEMLSKDEVGQLDRALHSMYTTIEKQIEIIKQEAAEKAQMQIQLLSAQINPHFLYNTLDCIRWEIIQDNKDISSQMVEELAHFLRIGLNHGSDLIPLEKELEHVQFYINIMNKRTQYHINYQVEIIPSNLKQFSILKLLLQPLVENSIKHGFNTINPIAIGIQPSIKIVIEQSDCFLIISVTDNGVGIDISSAEAAISHTDSSSQSKVGLSNIIKRLKAQYGSEVSINFYTMPFFENTVILKIPIKERTLISSP